MFAMRTAVHQALMLVGLLEKALTQKSFHPDYFSIGQLPGGDGKQAPGIRDVSLITHIVCHVTAVTGGFGTSKKQRRVWERQLFGHGIDDLADTTGHDAIDMQLTAAGVWEPAWEWETGLRKAFIVKDDPQRIVSRLALWQRYRGAPYHQIASQVGDALANRSLSKRTWHANAGNGGAGFAVDCGAKEVLSTDLVLTGRHALHMLGLRLQAGGAKPPFVLVPHRVYKYPGRASDTHRRVWRQIVRHAALTYPWLFRLGYDQVHPNGRPIPQSWDPDAWYDDRGKRRVVL